MWHFLVHLETPYDLILSWEDETSSGSIFDTCPLLKDKYMVDCTASLMPRVDEIHSHSNPGPGRSCGFCPSKLEVAQKCHSRFSFQLFICQVSGYSQAFRHDF